MGNYSVPKMIRARTADELFDELRVALREGWDIHTPMAAAIYEDEVYVFVVESLPLYEYYLIRADDLSELDVKVQTLADDGWDLFWNMVPFRGQYLQWMGRMKEKVVYPIRREEQESGYSTTELVSV